MAILCLYRGSFFQISSSLSATRSELHTWLSCRSWSRRRCWDKYYNNLIIIIVCLIHIAHCKTQGCLKFWKRNTNNDKTINQWINQSNRLVKSVHQNLPWYNFSGVANNSPTKGLRWNSPHSPHSCSTCNRQAKSDGHTPIAVQGQEKNHSRLGPELYHNQQPADKFGRATKILKQ